MSAHEPTSPWWLSRTPLEAEHHRRMQRRATDVLWPRSTAAALSPAPRERAAHPWRLRSQAEYLSMDLCAAGVFPESKP